ncbi:hypothetical protein ACWD4L_48905 [Streptomyces sp. NPDC002596]
MSADSLPPTLRGTDLEQRYALASHLHNALTGGYLQRLLAHLPEQAPFKEGANL